MPRRFQVKASKESGDNDVYFVVLDSAGFVESTHVVDESIAKSTERQLRSGGRKIRKFTDYDKYVDFIDENSDERRKQSRMSKGSVGASKSMKSRKQIAAATNRVKWVDHPVTRFYDGENHNLSSYFLYNDNHDIIAMINPVYDKTSDELTYHLDIIDPDTGKSRTIEDQCLSSKEAMDVYDERVGSYDIPMEATRKVECSMKKRFTVKASITAKKRKRVCAATMSAAAKDLYNDLYKYAKEYRFTSRWTADGVKKYLKRQQDFRRMSDAEFYGVVEKVNKDFKRKEKVKSYPYSEDSYKSDDVESAKSVKCSTNRRCSIKASNVPESDVDELYRIANNEVLPTTKIYNIAGICDIDDDTFDFTYTGTAFGAYLTYIIHVGISSSDIDLYTFMRKEWDDMFPDIRRDNPYGNYVQINLDVMVSGDRISVDIADADVYEKDTYSEYYSKKFARAFDIEAIEDHIKVIAEQAVDKIQATLSQYIPEDEDIMESSKVRSRKRVSASKRMRKSIKASADETISIAYNGNVVYTGSPYDMYGTLYRILFKDANAKIACGEYLNEFGDPLIDDPQTASASEVARVLTQMIGYDIDDADDDGVYHDIGSIEIFTGEPVSAAKSVKCGSVRKDDSVDPIDSEFMVDLYYSPNHKGRAGDRYFYDWSEAESYAHDALMSGLYVSIWNKNNGDILDISPDEYNEAWENGAADFDINEDIVRFKRAIVNSAKSIKCAAEEGFHLYAYDMNGADVSTAFAKTKNEIKDAVDDLFSYDETDTVDVYEGGMSGFGDLIKTYTRNDVEAAKSVTCSDNSDLTVDISNLELGEPYYEYREDDPENPDKWVLVIGKDVDKQMNFKLWYYMDTTDADLSELDLSNPDHIDLDEMSTMDDYEEIQLSQDIKCSTVTDMHGNQVNLVTL